MGVLIGQKQGWFAFPRYPCTTKTTASPRQPHEGWKHAKAAAMDDECVGRTNGWILFSLLAQAKHFNGRLQLDAPPPLPLPLLRKSHGTGRRSRLP